MHLSVSRQSRHEALSMRGSLSPEPERLSACPHTEGVSAHGGGGGALSAHGGGGGEGVGAVSCLCECAV